MGKNKLTLRDRLAIKAMEIIYARTKHLENYKELSKSAYNMADWMLKIREEQ
jgi:hypothetical protein